MFTFRLPPWRPRPPRPRVERHHILTAALVVAAALSTVGIAHNIAETGGAAADYATSTPRPVLAPTADVAAATGTSAARDPDEPGEAVTVATVTDGDTFQITDGRKVRVLGIDSCEDTGAEKTPGGADATARAVELLDHNQVRLLAEPGVDVDQWGRLLRYVTLPDGQDYGVAMVGYDHTGIYTDSKGRHGDASQAYLDELYAHDRDFSLLPPPAGRECGEAPPEPPAVDDGPEYVPVPNGDDDDDDGKSRYCRRHWFC